MPPLAAELPEPSEDVPPLAAASAAQPPRKKPRVRVDEAPEFVAEVASGLTGVGIPTPSAQAAVANAKKSSWKLEDDAVVDATREIPPSIDASVHAAFMRLPVAALPCGPWRP